MPDFIRARTIIDRQIRKAGGANEGRCLLRRNGVDRVCFAMEASLTTSERRALKSPTNRVFCISSIAENGALLSEGPVYGKDSLITFVQPEGVIENDPLRQVAPTSPFAPGGVMIYWDIEVQ